MRKHVEQVGGDHYLAAIQHWDLMEEHDVAYLEATATKYVARWRKKNGAEDLQKSLTYLRKMDGRGVRRRVPRESLWAWFHAAAIPLEEQLILKWILQEDYGMPKHIGWAITELERMVAEEGSHL